MSVFNRTASGHLSTEEVIQLAGTSRMVEEPLPKVKPVMDPGEMSGLLWDFMAETAGTLGYGPLTVPGWENVTETVRALWSSAVDGIARKFWEGNPINLWQEAEAAFELQNQIGGAFAIAWRDAPLPLRWAYWGAILLLTRLADYESGDEPDTIAEKEACREWVSDRYSERSTS
jgi:hypothetical protein